MEGCGDFLVEFGGFHAMGVDQEAAAGGVGARGQADGIAFAVFKLEHEIVRDVGREDQGRALDGENQRRFLQAEFLIRIDGAQRRQLCGFHRGKTNDDYGHGLTE